MNNLSVKDNVEFHSTGDPVLDGKVGVIQGFYGSATDEQYPIVLFAHPHPVGYNPAIVITPYCVKRV